MKNSKGVDVDFRVHARLLIVGIVVLIIVAKQWIRGHEQNIIGHPHF